MAVTLSNLLALPDLGLQLVAGAGNVDRRVEAAHVSELTRPGEWLQGGELLMTTALVLPMDRRSCRAYVTDVRRGGACGLALGLGHGQPYQQAPGPLVEAAEEAGLPLLTVPDEVPFIAVTKAVFSALAQDERHRLARAIAVQRDLTAASSRGLDRVLAVWEDATACDAVVVDIADRPIAASPAADADVLAPVASDLRAELDEGELHASAMGADDDGTPLRLQPLGAERLRGHVLLVGELTEHRALLPVLAALLSLELERRHHADEPARRRRADALGRVLAAPGDDVAEEVLASVGITAATVRAVAIRPAEGEAAALAADLTLAVPDSLVRVSDDLVEWLVAGDGAVDHLLERFARGSPAGIGAAVRPAAAAVSVTQARGLVPASSRLGHPVRTGEAGTTQLLVSLGPPELLAAFSDTALAAVDRADPHGELTATLRVWLDAGGVAEDAAGRLQVHRHTVRNRLDRIEALTGRRLDTMADRHELWLALEVRGLLSGR